MVFLRFLKFFNILETILQLPYFGFLQSFWFILGFFLIFSVLLKFFGFFPDFSFLKISQFLDFVAYFGIEGYYKKLLILLEEVLENILQGQVSEDIHSNIVSKCQRILY